MTLRAIGPFNGLLPVPTGMVVGFMRDPKTMPYLNYAQLIPAPEIQFQYFYLDPDAPVSVKSLDSYAWAYDDYRPTGKSFQVRGEWIESRTVRYDFPYTIGEATIRVWNKQGIDPKMLYDRVRSNHAALHRASRVVSAMSAASWGNNTAALNTLLGTTGEGFDTASGRELIATSGSDGVNESFQIIKRAFQAVQRRIHLATNGAVQPGDLVAVLPPLVAQAMARSGEIFEALKYNQGRDLAIQTDGILNNAKWGLPEYYCGVKLVVEDTPRVYINQIAAGTVADVTNAAERDYILNTDTVYFVSRTGGLDGGYGFQNFSTVQCYHFGGEARVEAFSEPKHDLIEGHVVLEDKVLVPAPLSGFKLTDVLAA